MKSRTATDAFAPIPLPPPASNVSDQLRSLVDPDPATSSSVFTPLPPPTAPRRPNKCYDMRSLRSQVTALHSELKSRAKSMEALYEQNLLLWERVELYKSNITENEVKAMNANAKIKDVGRIAEERRREAFNHLRGASKLRDGKGQELQHSKHEESEAMKTVMAMRSKLESVLDQERKRMVDVELALDEDHRRKEEIKERKRYLDRAKNLQMVEDKLQDWWERSSRGMSRSFALLLRATKVSKKMDRISQRFSLFTTRHYQVLSFAHWKRYHNQRVKHVRRKPATLLLRTKKRMVQIVRAWSGFAHSRRLTRFKYIHSLMRRNLWTWRDNVEANKVDRHDRIMAQGAKSKLSLKVSFKKLAKFAKACTLPKDTMRSLNRKATVHHRNALFHKWQRKVLGLRLTEDFDCFALSNIRNRSRLRILKRIFGRISKHTGVQRISRKRLRREFFRKWRIEHRLQMKEFELEYRADMMQHRVLLKRGLRTFQAFVALSRREHSADLHFLKVIFNRYLENVRFAQNQRVKALVATNHYFTHLTRIAFNGWRFKSTKADMFLMKKNGRLVGKIFRSWVMFIPLIRHEEKRNAIIDKMNEEKAKLRLANIVKKWREHAVKRKRTNITFEHLKHRIDTEKKRSALSSWFVVYMRVKRAKNTVTEIEDKTTSAHLNELNETKGGLIEKQRETSERRSEIEIQLQEARDMEAELKLKAVETNETIELRSLALAKVKMEIQKNSEGLAHTLREAAKLEKIEKQRQREEDKTTRKANIRKLKGKKELGRIREEKEKLQEAIASAQEVMKQIEGSIDEDRKASIDLIHAFEKSAGNANKEVLTLRDEEAKERAELERTKSRLEEVRVEKVRAEHERKDQKTKLSDGLFADRTNELNLLRMRVAESEKRAEEAVLLLREKEEEIMELQVEMKQAKESQEMKRLVNAADSAGDNPDRPLGLSLSDIGIAIKPSEEGRKRREEEKLKARKGKLPKFPKMKSVQRNFITDARDATKTELRLQELENLGQAFDLAVSGNSLWNEAEGEEGNADANNTSQASSAATSSPGVPDTTLTLLELAETSTPMYGVEDLQNLEDTIDEMTKRLISRLSAGEEMFV